ncbi:hypothetical protein J8F10_22400 [Gemmata sp. G18]|uniref:Uncharacterized protein n=1 Tax=Gemmata palustris TaxID=2822762 RepID=A0ABS5BWF6_9BACT|nr:hypothetical protein [Gemmata palustris]MBP3958016.1 hypothetical protein [Gemmata palustris]
MPQARREAPGAAGDVLKEAAARRQIEEQRYRVLADATVRRARQVLRTDPEGAYQDLKRQRDEILGYDGLGAEARPGWSRTSGGHARGVREGAEIKRQADAERQALAKTKQRLNEFDRAADAQASDKNRIDQFRQLMQHARYELAYQEAQLMVQEKTSKGLAVPPTATASYIIGQQATQLREWKELTRIREDRFLQAMMQTEKSHIPYPDEPRCTSPGRGVARVDRAPARGVPELEPGPERERDPEEAQERDRERERGPRGQEHQRDPAVRAPSRSCQAVQRVVRGHGGVLQGRAAAHDQEEKPKIAATQLRGLKLGNFLDIVLLSMNATFIVRPGLHRGHHVPAAPRGEGDPGVPGRRPRDPHPTIR